ncbi:hypothetical protein [Rhizobium leguminosarum]|uniref:hypothetical protein n=1 Tax=Rhizobium leguminosarum TaxID=384 RepID=UPI002E131BC9|nr:hypothetical protein U8Q02_36575 [Rhizobium leguminosarum]
MTNGIARLLGDRVFDIGDDDPIETIASHVRPGAMMHGALLILSDEQRRSAARHVRALPSEFHEGIPFAADLFGDFWMVHPDGAVRKVLTETVEVDRTEDRESLDAWAEAVLADPDVEVGEKFALAWAEENGSIPNGKRLTGKTPFVMGGEYSLDNLYAIDFDELMAVRLHVGLEIRDLPDGSSVVIDVVD